MTSVPRSPVPGQASEEFVRGKIGARGEFVPDPEVLGVVDGDGWVMVGKAVDLAFAQGHTVGCPYDPGAVKACRGDEEAWFTEAAWAAFTGRASSSPEGGADQ